VNKLTKELKLAIIAGGFWFSGLVLTSPLMLSVAYVAGRAFAR
jgi:hypothetical protein